MKYWRFVRTDRMRRAGRLKAILCFTGAFIFQVWITTDLSAGEIHPQFPVSIDPKRSYVIYSHGQIVEGTDPRPVHARWGTYDFPAVTSTMADGAAFVLIAHQRPKNTKVSEYVKRLVEQVDDMVEAGVPPERITLVGFSRGGQITALAAAELKPMKLNIALLGTCWNGSVKDTAAVTLSGRLLSIYETSDQSLSCKSLADRSAELTSFDEVAISTGKEHGAFFTPLPEWLVPLLAWIEQTSN